MKNSKTTNRGINKKINDLYVSKQITLIIPYRGKLREVRYIITDFYGTEMQMTATLRSVKYPCEIPKMDQIQMRVNNEFPSKKNTTN